MIKPEFFDDPVVGELSLAARLLFIGLWTEADSQGRLIADMRQLKVRIFPYDAIELPPIVAELEAAGVLKTYDAGAKHPAIWICNFRKHQRPHPKEPGSVIPEYSENVKRNGTPLKETANPPESGSFNGILNTESGERNLENGIPVMKNPVNCGIVAPIKSAGRPQPPKGGFIPRDIRERAKHVREKARGRCTHQPKCSTYDTCVEKIAREIQAQSA